jgi:hypothetical protein
VSRRLCRCSCLHAFKSPAGHPASLDPRVVAARRPAAALTPRGVADGWADHGTAVGTPAHSIESAQLNLTNPTTLPCACPHNTVGACRGTCACFSAPLYSEPHFLRTYYLTKKYAHLALPQNMSTTKQHIIRVFLQERKAFSLGGKSNFIYCEDMFETHRHHTLDQYLQR